MITGMVAEFGVLQLKNDPYVKFISENPPAYGIH